MHPLPHRYHVHVHMPSRDAEVVVGSRGLPPLPTATPPEFDGPVGRWSPETLLVAAALDCFALTFRGVARASKLDWTSLTCEAEGTLDRVDHVMQFVAFTIRARVDVADDASVELARHVAEKADRTCLIANSLKARTRLEVDVQRATVGSNHELQFTQTFTEADCAPVR
jgi:organic hydroperoxide reductase OsmC/OhrA